MSLTTIEILATIVIVLAIVKILTLLFAPSFFVNFAKKIYGCPKMLKTIAFILAVIVFYFLVKAGITIVTFNLFPIAFLISLFI